MGNDMHVVEVTNVSFGCERPGMIREHESARGDDLLQPSPERDQNHMEVPMTPIVRTYPEWINIADAAEMLPGISYAKLSRWVNADMVPSEAPSGAGSGNRRYLHVSTIELLARAAPIHRERRSQTILDVMAELGEPATTPRWIEPSPKSLPSPAIETLARLVTTETDDCIEWPLGRYPSGYGRVHADGRSTYTHRQALILRGEMPTTENNVARHLCNNKPCVNPRHLRWGTQQDNVDDRTQHGVWAESMRKRRKSAT